MVQAVGNLYANLLRFFIRAHDWCSEGSFRHLVHSITRPVELRYKDLVDDIAGDSLEIDKLATMGARVEIREMNTKLNSIVAKLDAFHTMHSSSLVDTNQRLSDLQFSQVMSHMSAGKLGDPLRAYQFNVALQRRQNRSKSFETTNKFWQSPKLNDWSSMPESKMTVIKGSFRARFAMRNFSLSIIQQLQSKNIPVLWALPGPKDESEAAKVSAVDLFKHLIFQALKLEQDALTESGMALQCSQFHRATTEHQWIQLLGSALLRARSQVYVVIDLSILDRNLEPADGFSWFAAFQQLFTELSKRSPNLQVKILILSDTDSNWTRKSDYPPRDILIPVRVTQIPVRNRKRMNHSIYSYQNRDYCL